MKVSVPNGPSDKKFLFSYLLFAVIQDIVGLGLDHGDDVLVANVDLLNSLHLKNQIFVTNSNISETIRCSCRSKSVSFTFMCLRESRLSIVDTMSEMFSRRLQKASNFPKMWFLLRRR